MEFVNEEILQILLENKGNDSNGIPNLVYVAREKRPNQPHYYKAGALNVLVSLPNTLDILSIISSK